MYDVNAELLMREREILEKLAYRDRGRTRRMPRAESRRSTRRSPGQSAADRSGI